MIKVKTKPCIHCGKESVVEMTEDQLRRYIENVENIQDIFPDWSLEQRELIISGTHPKCWDEIFPDEEE